MSFDLYVHCFERGEFSGTKRDRVRDVFGAELSESEPDLWQLYYDDTNSCDLFLTNHGSGQNMIRGFSV
ncbi:MAG: hypothetical protein QOK44_1407, partial [Betaproteobacteria bacterium]|nr:hypothetical protein [Betaproteobacteria bacterium]